MRVEASLRALLVRLSTTLDGRVAIVSGRPAAEIDRLFGLEALAIGGSHGLELRWANGRANRPERPAALDRVIAEMRALRADHPGVLVEEKPLGAALHFRAAPDAEEACRSLAERLAARSGLALQPGKMVFELRAPGASKGAAVGAFMADAPMRGTRPVFLGDDLTDEPGFAEAARLGGAGVLVGPTRATRARYRLADVTAVIGWLEQACEALA